MDKSKTHKEEIREIKKPDAFMARGRALVMAFVSHKGALTAVIAAVLIVYLGTWFYQTQKEKKLDVAFARYQQVDKAGEKWRFANQELENTLKKIKEIETKPQATKDNKESKGAPAENEVLGLKLKSAEQEKKELDLRDSYLAELKTLQKDQNQFPNIIKILTLNNLAQMQIKEKKWDEAINNLKTAATFADASDLVISPIYHSIAYCFEEKGEYQNALDWTQKNLSLREPFSKAEILLVQGRLFKQLGQKDKAKLVYEQVIKDYAGTEFENRGTSYLQLLSL